MAADPTGPGRGPATTAGRAALAQRPHPDECRHGNHDRRRTPQRDSGEGRVPAVERDLHPDEKQREENRQMNRFDDRAIQLRLGALRQAQADRADDPLQHEGGHGGVAEDFPRRKVQVPSAHPHSFARTGDGTAHPGTKTAGAPAHNNS